jgi:hypothetical protein
MLIENPQNSNIYLNFRPILTTIMVLVIPLLLVSSTITGISTYNNADAKKYKNPNQKDSDAGWDDGIADCQLGYRSHINQPTNAEQQNSVYMASYNDAYSSCGTGSNNNPQNTAKDSQNPTQTTTIDNSQQVLQGNNNIPSGSNGQGTDFRPICNTLQIALYHSCSELVNPDGSLTSVGQVTVKCTLSGAAIGGIASFVLPTGVVIDGLNFLAGQTGCGGLVKLDLLSSIGNINGILNQLTKFIH